MGRSHMPEGLEAKMDHQQMADLFAFIGRCGPARRELPGNRPELITAEPDGSLALSAARCEVYAPGIKMSGTQFLVWFYRGPNDHVAWSVDVPAPGAYEVWIEWAQIDEYADNPIAVEVEGTSAMLATRLPSTGGWGNVRKEPFGVLGLEAGRQRIRLRPNGPNKTEVADLRGLHLVPVKQGK